MPHEKRYFIEYRICGKLRLDLINLKDILSKNFPELEQYLFNEPHITLIPPINQKISEKYISQVIKEEFRHLDILEFKVEGYDFFNNEDEKVIFVKIKFDKETLKLRKNLLRKLRTRAEISDKYEKDGFNSHIALGFTKKTEEARKIVKFLNENYPLNLSQIFDRINLFNGGKIVFSYDLFNKTILSGHKALSPSQRLQNIRKIILLKNKRNLLKGTRQKNYENPYQPLIIAKHGGQLEKGIIENQLEKTSKNSFWSRIKYIFTGK